MPEDELRLTIRIPKDLHDRLTAQAKHEMRSLNNLMLVALMQYVDTAKKK